MASIEAELLQPDEPDRRKLVGSFWVDQQRKRRFSGFLSKILRKLPLCGRAIASRGKGRR